VNTLTLTSTNEPGAKHEFCGRQRRAIEGVVSIPKSRTACSTERYRALVAASMFTCWIKTRAPWRAAISTPQLSLGHGGEKGLDGHEGDKKNDGAHQKFQ